jgi:hypothetical protein
MKIADNIKKLLHEKPYWSASRVAEELDLSRNCVSVVASRHKIKFMTRRELEDWVDGQT